MTQSPDPNTPAPKRVRRNRREEIVVETTKLFGKHGFQGTTLSMIAEAVNLTEPGVLHYFPSKVHLLQGVLEHRDQNDFERYAVLLNSSKEDISELFNLIQQVHQEQENFPELIQLFIVLVGESINHEHPSHDFFVDRYRRGREIYVEQFLALNKAKLPSDIDLHAFASLIMAIIDGLQIQWLLDPEQVDLAATFDLFCKFVVGYLGDNKAAGT